MPVKAERLFSNQVITGFGIALPNFGLFAKNCIPNALFSSIRAAFEDTDSNEYPALIRASVCFPLRTYSATKKSLSRSPSRVDTTTCNLNRLLIQNLFQVHSTQVMELQA